MTEPKEKTSLISTWLPLVIIVATIGFLYFVGSGAWGGSITARWHWMIGIMIVFILLLGKIINNRWDGVFIDWRKKMSLSHFQVILWTILGTSAFLTIGLTRISTMGKIVYNPEMAYQQAQAVGGVECLKDLTEGAVTEDVLKKCPAPEPLQIIFPEELLLAMGISLASFVGSSLIKSNQSTTKLISEKEEQQRISEIADIKDASTKVTETKEQIKVAEGKRGAAERASRPAEVKAADEEIARLNDDLKGFITKSEDYDNKINELNKPLKEMEKAEGLLQVNKTTKDAQWSDIFKKEKVGEQDLIDLSKVQMFFFTIVVISAYAAALNNLLQQPDLIENPFGVALPAFSTSLVVLLGISHGGYLGSKANMTSDSPKE